MISGTFRAVVTATAAAGIGITAFGDRFLLVLTVAGIAALFALGWPTLLEMPARRSGVILLALIGGAAIGALLVLGGPALRGGGAWARRGGRVRAGGWFRRDGRPRLVESVSGVVTGAVAMASAAGWLAIGTGQVSGVCSWWER